MRKIKRKEIEFEDMKVAVYKYDNFGSENDPKSDWAYLTLGGACFTHTDACEFIIFIDSNNLDTWKTFGISDRLIELAKSAQDQGYKYLCLYA